MNPANSKKWLLLVLLPLGFAGVWELQQRIDIQRGALHQECAVDGGPLLDARGAILWRQARET
jgi:hypothetical protein